MTFPNTRGMCNDLPSYCNLLSDTRGTGREDKREGVFSETRWFSMKSYGPLFIQFLIVLSRSYLSRFGENLCAPATFAKHISCQTSSQSEKGTSCFSQQCACSKKCDVPFLIYIYFFFPVIFGFLFSFFPFCFLTFSLTNLWSYGIYFLIFFLMFLAFVYTVHVFSAVLVFTSTLAFCWFGIFSFIFFGSLHVRS